MPKLPSRLKPKILYPQYGSKAKIAGWISSYFHKHSIYMEPFCGSCAVLFAKKRSAVEFVNDADARIINLFERIRSNPAELAALLWATPYAKGAIGGVSVDSLEDARLAIAQKQQEYTGDWDGHNWTVSTSGVKPNAWAKWFLRVAPAAVRLKAVQLLNEDAVDAILRVWKCPNALIYADPPYFGHEDAYRYRVDYNRLVCVLKEARCKVVVSEYPAADNYWKPLGWRRVVKQVRATTAMGGAADHDNWERTEVLWLNY